MANISPEISELIENFHWNIGQSMRTLREMAGMTQREAAAAISSSQMHISEVENGKAKVSLSYILRMCEAYGHDLELEFYPKESEDGTVSQEAC